MNYELWGGGRSVKNTRYLVVGFSGVIVENDNYPDNIGKIIMNVDNMNVINVLFIMDGTRWN
jgi:hypothetical protein